MCTLNGRFNLDSDNFTCISTKGKSVVYYFLIPNVMAYKENLKQKYIYKRNIFDKSLRKAERAY